MSQMTLPTLVSLLGEFMNRKVVSIYRFASLQRIYLSD